MFLYQHANSSQAHKVSLQLTTGKHQMLFESEHEKL